MQEWLVLALIFPAIFAVINIIDDNFLRKVYRSPYFGAIISGYFGMIPLLGIFFYPLHFVSIALVLLGLLSGFISVFYYYFYFKGLEKENPSIVIALFNLTPVFALILSYFFLNEKISSMNLLGFLIILGASIALSISEMSLKKIVLTKALAPILVASFIYALAGVLIKPVYNGVDFYSGYFYFCLGLGMGAFCLSILNNESRKFYGQFRNKIKKFFLIFVVTELLGISADIINNFAISKGPVALVKVVEGIQPLYVLLYALILFPFFPKFFREASDRRKIKKMICMVAMLMGLYLISS